MKPSEWNTPTTALGLNNLAYLYYAKGDYVKADPLYLRAHFENVVLPRTHIQIQPS